MRTLALGLTLYHVGGALCVYPSVKPAYACFHMQIRSSRVCSCALWILGEYSTGVEEIQAAAEVMKQSLGPTPFLAKEGQ